MDEKKPFLSRRMVEILCWAGLPVVPALCLGLPCMVLSAIGLIERGVVYWDGMDSEGHMIGGTYYSGWDIAGIRISDVGFYGLAGIAFLILVGLWVVLILWVRSSRQRPSAMA